MKCFKKTKRQTLQISGYLNRQVSMIPRFHCFRFIKLLRGTVEIFLIIVDNCTMLWRYERSSRLIRNLSNCEREAWKKFRLQRDSNPWPLRYRCSALPTELWSHNCWEQVNFSGSIMPLRVIQHYIDWVCTAVMSNDVMKDLHGWYAI